MKHTRTSQFFRIVFPSSLSIGLQIILWLQKAQFQIHSCNTHDTQTLSMHCSCQGSPSPMKDQRRDCTICLSYTAGPGRADYLGLVISLQWSPPAGTHHMALNIQTWNAEAIEALEEASWSPLETVPHPGSAFKWSVWKSSLWWSQCSLCSD